MTMANFEHLQTSVAVLLLEFNMFSTFSTQELVQSLVSGSGVLNLCRARSQNHQLVPAAPKLETLHGLVAFLPKSAFQSFPRQSV